MQGQITDLVCLLIQAPDSLHSPEGLVLGTFAALFPTI